MQRKEQARRIQQHLEREQQQRNEHTARELERIRRENEERRMREQRAQHDRNDQNASNQQRHEQPRPADDQNNGVNIDINTLVTRISDEILRRVDSRATNQPQPPQDRNIQTYIDNQMLMHQNPNQTGQQEPDVNINSINQIRSRLRDIRVSSGADASELRQLIRNCDLLFEQTATIPEERVLVSEIKFKLANINDFNLDDVRRIDRYEDINHVITTIINKDNS